VKENIWIMKAEGSKCCSCMQMKITEDQEIQERKCKNMVRLAQREFRQ